MSNVFLGLKKVDPVGGAAKKANLKLRSTSPPRRKVSPPDYLDCCRRLQGKKRRLQDSNLKKLGNAMSARDIEEPECYKCHLWLNQQWVVVAAWCGDMDVSECL